MHLRQVCDKRRHLRQRKATRQCDNTHRLRQGNASATREFFCDKEHALRNQITSFETSFICKIQSKLETCYGVLTPTSIETTCNMKLQLIFKLPKTFHVYSSLEKLY